MQQQFTKALLLGLTAFGLLAASLNADARAIRFDGEGAQWTDPVTSSAPSTDVDDIGFTFNFFGTSTVSLTINADGSVSFGGALIALFLDATQSLSYSYSTTIEPPIAGIPSAIRIQWGNEADENQFQLAIFDLTDDVYAMEFNYAQIVNGGDDTSSIGYDNGAGVTFDLLAELGLAGTLPFVDYMGIGADLLDANDEFFDSDNVLCDDPGLILACNNYNAVTGEFGSAASLLPPDFFGYFQFDPTFVEPTQGRYFFLIDNRDDTLPPASVPEPGTLWLLCIGIVMLALIRRRRATGTQRP